MVRSRFSLGFRKMVGCFGTSDELTDANFALGIQFFFMTLCALISPADPKLTLLIFGVVIAIANIITIWSAPVRFDHISG